MGFEGHPLSKSMTKTPTFESVVAKLSPKAKQAMYAAASRGTIVRGDWDGCAFNAAGSILDDPANIGSTSVAAHVFGMDTIDVGNFIDYWDSLKGSNEECTELLKTTLLAVGLFDEPKKRTVRVTSKRVYTSQETAALEALEKLVETFEVPAEDEAMQLLCSVGATDDRDS